MSGWPARGSPVDQVTIQAEVLIEDDIPCKRLGGKGMTDRAGAVLGPGSNRGDCGGQVRRVTGASHLADPRWNERGRAAVLNPHDREPASDGFERRKAECLVSTRHDEDV